jgi:hypothetical protein
MAKHYTCAGNLGGCNKPPDARCALSVVGSPPQGDEHLYMCPYNHWRSARWEPVTRQVDATTQAGSFWGRVQHFVFWHVLAWRMLLCGKVDLSKCVTLTEERRDG